MNNKKSFKINLVDVLLIAAAAVTAAIISVYMFAGKVSESVSPKKNVYISAVSKKLDEGYASAIKQGDKIYNTQNGELIGTVSTVSLESSYESVISSQDGTYEKIYYPDLYDASLVIAASVSDSYTGSVKSGAHLFCSNKDVAFELEISSVTEAEQFIELAPSYGQRSQETSAEQNDESEELA